MERGAWFLFMAEQTLLGININRQLLHLDLLKVVGTKVKKIPLETVVFENGA